jgi:hypothetical protein
MLREAWEILPLIDLRADGPACAARGCRFATQAAAQGMPARAVDGQSEPGRAGMLVSEWDVLALEPALAEDRVHFIAVDPPYRREHVDFVNRLSERGVHVHLYYGEQERQTTARLLRYLVHPRFAMVCVYRAWEELRTDGQGAEEAEVLALAAEFGWNEARVVLSREQLSRALATLEALGMEQLAVGEAKLEARSIPAYAEAEAEYEECSRLCLNL